MTIARLWPSWLSPVCVVWLALSAPSANAQKVEPTAFAELQVKPQVLTLQYALQFALENNPSLATQRRQRGIASARLIIAETYPFNPVLEMRTQYASGPEVAGVTNKVPVESLLLWEVEVRGQRQFRKEGAAAALSRTEWEIAYQEQTLAVQVIRTYGQLLYRREKLRLLEETLKINEGLADDVRKLVDLAKLRTPELIPIQTEVSVTLDLVSAGRESLAAARQEFIRGLGAVEAQFDLEGMLEPPPWVWNNAEMEQLALARRADLRAQQMAVTEASANMQLTAANRYGNPILGPVYGFDPSKIRTIGVQANIPLPSFNIHRGEMFQSEAEYVQAVTLLRQRETNVRQDVASALARLAAAESRAEIIRRKALPDVERAGEDMRKLFEAGEPGVDIIKVIDTRRKILSMRDSYLDALWSVRQARADLLAATGEPALEFGKPTELPPPGNAPAKMGMPKK